MKSLKNILEASILDIEDTLKASDIFMEYLNLIELWKKHYINFNMFIKEHLMKDAKSYKHKTGPQYEDGIDGFDNKKKYFFIVKEAVKYDTGHPLAKQYPKLAKFIYKIYINDDEYVGRTMLTDNGREKIDIDNAHYYKNGIYYPMYKYKKYIGEFMFNYGKTKVEVYEVPKQYEWLYNYIKERKLC